jgi:hypothetical protein
MPRSATLVVLAAAVVGGSLVASALDAEAQTRRARTETVVITPRWLTAGPLRSPGEQMYAVPNADARFVSTGRDLPGLTYQEPRYRDPWYLPHPQSTIYFDGPLGRKLPGEQ